MKLMLIFISFFCFHACSFHSVTTTQHREGLIENQEIAQNPSPESKKDANPSPKKIKSSKSQQPRSSSFGLSPSLELIMKDDGKFEIRRDFIPLREVENISKMVYFCPGESVDEHEIETITTYKYCLFIKTKSNAALSSVQCSYEVESKLWNYPDHANTCGENHQGVRYWFLHELCWHEKSVRSKIPRVKSGIDKVSKLQNDFVQVYSICMLKQKELLYLKYYLVVPSPEEYYKTKKSYDLQSKTPGFVQLNLKPLKKFFENTEQNGILKEVFGEEFSDFLIPQMLISPKHMKPLIARNSLYNYVNIKPQWKSLEQDWLTLEDHLREIGLQYWKDITIYAGTYETIRKGNQEVYFQIDEKTKQNIPLIWWKLIVKKSKHEGIILAMQNVPAGYPNLMGKKLCNKSICNSYGWTKINKFAYCCAFNETLRKMLNLHEEKIKIRKVFDPTSSKNFSRISKWIRHLLKL